GGLGLALVVVLSLAAATVRGDAPDTFSRDGLVVAGLCAVTAVVSLAGWAVGSAAAFGRPGTGAALAVLAGAVPSWLSALGVLVVAAFVAFLRANLGRPSAPSPAPLPAE